MNRLLKLLLPILTVPILGLAGYYGYLLTQKPQRKTPEQARKEVVKVAKDFSARKREDIVMKVGKENIFQADLTYTVKTYHPKAATSEATLTKAVDQAMEKIITDSIILQEGQREGYATLSATVFNTVDKNITERNRLVETTKKKLEEKNISMITGESISIWFHNQTYPEPAMGYEKAREVAKGKMDAIHADLVAKKITFKQAAEGIFSDTSLRDIDLNYQGNAYFRFVNRPLSSELFVNPKTQSVAWSIKAGEVSPVLTITDCCDKKTGKEYDALFKIIKIDEKNETGFGSFAEWYKTRRDTYEIKVY